ncbi:NADPH-dependent FMN reductase [Sediminibacterium ginsengisoli]|uniref:NAD(P)H-dependent FMN reductase n=1 Tax=Sediminibacterium ginsengisoli TaxID=413434 RepID=A0A1T4M6T3_9BACT|nr:NAD(P)H-dependent oxidoreductase [Sediminibacterium ginsengisoli]SJZ62488.1 NAD(P)H-dependent FMN reductase [Sediminibacterium ginsengisoli]
MNIEIISGSPRKDSVTNRLTLFLEKHLAAHTRHNIGVIDVRDWNLPLLQDVFTSVDKTPDPFKPLAERMFAADAFILVTPEYNASYSPALQNLLDHFPKQSHKAFGVVTASTGALGGMRSSQQLLLLIAALFGVASPNMLITPFVDKKFDESGRLTDEAFRKNVDVFMKEFLWLAESLHPEMNPAYN